MFHRERISNKHVKQAHQTANVVVFELATAVFIAKLIMLPDALVEPHSYTATQP